VVNFDVVRAQKEYYQKYVALKESGTVLDESQEAILFTKILQMQTVYDIRSIVFCSDDEFYVSKTPTGYAITGFYELNSNNGTRIRKPFNVTVCKNQGLWYPSVQYVAADTKSGSNFIILWILLSLGCTFMGIVMYFLISVEIGF